MKNKKHTTARRLRSALAFGLSLHVAASLGFGEIQSDVVFLLDGSDSVDECLFEFEKETLGRLICGPECDPCSDVHLPHDSTIAISVIQFAGGAVGQAQEEIPLTIIDSTPTAQTLCGQIRGHGPEDISQAGGTTPLVAGLELAREVFEQDGHEGAERLVVILSDIMEIAFGDLATPAAAEALRTLCDGAASCRCHLRGSAPIPKLPVAGASGW